MWASLGAMHGKPRRPLRRLRTCVVGSASAVRPTDATAADREVEARTGSHERAAHPSRASAGRAARHPVCPVHRAKSARAVRPVRHSVAGGSSLVDRLGRSWTDVGAKLKDYRDCTQHFASTDIGMGAVTMWRIAPGVWTAWARIPDNPEVKSKAKFTYARGHDALTYGWEVANELISLAVESVALSQGAQKS